MIAAKSSKLPSTVAIGGLFAFQAARPAAGPTLAWKRDPNHLRAFVRHGDGKGRALAHDIPTTTDGVAKGSKATTSEGMLTIRARTVARGTIWQDIYIRDFPPRHSATDHAAKDLENQSLSADDLASNPMEDLLAALGACLTRSIHANALARDIPITHIETTAEADMHRAGRWGGTGNAKPIGFETIRVLVHIDAAVPRDVLADLVRTTALWSPVANTLFNPVHLAENGD